MGQGSLTPTRFLGHATCPPPYPQAGLHGAILYPPQKKQGMNFAPRGPLALGTKK